MFQELNLSLVKKVISLPGKNNKIKSYNTTKLQFKLNKRKYLITKFIILKSDCLYFTITPFRILNVARETINTS